MCAKSRAAQETLWGSEHLPGNWLETLNFHEARWLLATTSNKHGLGQA